MVNITAQYMAVALGSVDDEKVLRERGYPEEQIRRTLSQRKIPTVEVNGIRFKVPLTRFSYSLMGYLGVLFENYQKGNLPFAGSVSEQPAQIIELFGLLQSLKTEHQNNLNQRQEEAHGRYNSSVNRASGRRSSKSAK